MIDRGFDFRQDYVALNELGQTLFERAKMERANEAKRNEFRSRDQGFEQALFYDSASTAHYNSLIHSQLGDEEKARIGGFTRNTGRTITPVTRRLWRRAGPTGGGQRRAGDHDLQAAAQGGTHQDIPGRRSAAEGVDLANAARALFNTCRVAAADTGQVGGFSGIGLHSGNKVSMTLLPAPPNTGILRRRSRQPRGNPGPSQACSRRPVPQPSPEARPR